MLKGAHRRITFSCPTKNGPGNANSREDVAFVVLQQHDGQQPVDAATRCRRRRRRCRRRCCPGRLDRRRRRGEQRGAENDARVDIPCKDDVLQRGPGKENPSWAEWLTLCSQSSFKQYVTLYNPYDWPLRFKLLCTSAKLYDVRPPKGVLRPQSSLDMYVCVPYLWRLKGGVCRVVRIKDFGSPHKDRFLLQILDDDDNTVNEKPIAVSVMLGTPVVVTNQQQQQQQQQQQHYTAGATGSRVYTDKDHELCTSIVCVCVTHPRSFHKHQRRQRRRATLEAAGQKVRALPAAAVVYRLERSCLSCCLLCSLCRRPCPPLSLS